MLKTLLTATLVGVGFSQFEDQWVRILGSADKEDSARGAALSQTGNLWTVGSLDDSCHVAAWTQDGDFRFSSRIDTPVLCYSMSVALSPARSFVCGFAFDSANNMQIYMASFDNQGNLNWDTLTNTTNSETYRAEAVPYPGASTALLDESAFICGGAVTGWGDGAATGNQDSFVLRVYPNGTFANGFAIGGADAEDAIYAVHQVSSSQNIFAVGGGKNQMHVFQPDLMLTAQRWVIDEMNSTNYTLTSMDSQGGQLYIGGFRNDDTAIVISYNSDSSTVDWAVEIPAMSGVRSVSLTDTSGLLVLGDGAGMYAGDMVLAELNTAQGDDIRWIKQIGSMSYDEPATVLYYGGQQSIYVIGSTNASNLTTTVDQLYLNLNTTGGLAPDCAAMYPNFKSLDIAESATPLILTIEESPEPAAVQPITEVMMGNSQPNVVDFAPEDTDIPIESVCGVTFAPTQSPSSMTTQPTAFPSAQPSESPSREPSMGPTANPSQEPSLNPSSGPTLYPSAPPTVTPPTQNPSSSAPSAFPSDSPTQNPSTMPTAAPHDPCVGNSPVNPLPSGQNTFIIEWSVNTSPGQSVALAVGEDEDTFVIAATTDSGLVLGAFDSRGTQVATRYGMAGDTATTVAVSANTSDIVFGGSWGMKGFVAGYDLDANSISWAATLGWTNTTETKIEGTLETRWNDMIVWGSHNNGKHNGFVIRVDQMTNEIIWKAFLNNSYVVDVVMSDPYSDMYVATGYWWDEDTNTTESFLAGFDATTGWPDDNVFHRWGGSESDMVHAVAHTCDGYVTVGSTYSCGGKRLNALVTKWDWQGGVEWAKSFGADDEEEFFDIVRTSDDSFVLVGYSRSYHEVATSNHSEAVVLKIDADGNYDWGFRLGISDVGIDDMLWSVTELEDYSLLIAGTAGDNVVAIRMGSDGDLGDCGNRVSLSILDNDLANCALTESDFSSHMTLSLNYTSVDIVGTNDNSAHDVVCREGFPTTEGPADDDDDASGSYVISSVVGIITAVLFTIYTF